MVHEKELQAADQAVHAAHSLIRAQEADIIRMRAAGLNTQRAERCFMRIATVLDWLRNGNGLSVARNNHGQSVKWRGSRKGLHN